ncbi:uncharacterized protein LOC111694435 [Trichogramma pretiosum]|uniref:uncharacterized protein LOC111694435 n=1 Tax=Trichogramma pretiosum TaxID=7493 RepID=UPI000C719A82|nr:uncharacterized protein LOC111694435 [Trichogramma pretiosum]
MLFDIKLALAKTNCVCTTADAWSSKHRRFLGVTAHWIDDNNLSRKSVALACRNFPGTHSFDNVTNLLEEIHTFFELPLSKLAGTVTDNGSNFVKAFKEFGIVDEDFD